MLLRVGGNIHSNDTNSQTSNNVIALFFDSGLFLNYFKKTIYLIVII